MSVHVRLSYASQNYWTLSLYQQEFALLSHKDGRRRFHGNPPLPIAWSYFILHCKYPRAQITQYSLSPSKGFNICLYYSTETLIQCSYLKCICKATSLKLEYMWEFLGNLKHTDNLVLPQETDVVSLGGDGD